MKLALGVRRRWKNPSANFDIADENLDYVFIAF